MKDLCPFDVSFTFDSDGKECVYLQKPLTQKNVKPSLTPKDFYDRKQARMYAADNHENCPVKIMRLYLLMPSRKMSSSPRSPPALELSQAPNQTAVGTREAAMFVKRP